MTNRLLARSPDRKLARIAWLSTVNIEYNLTKPGCVIYAVCGPFPTYVGQCGAIHGERPLIDRFREHCKKARAIRNHYVGKHCKRRAGAIRQGKLPSLARVLARHGSHNVTIVPLEQVSSSEACERERFWDRVLSPTLNQKVPYGGLDPLTWEFLATDRVEAPEQRTLKHNTEFLLKKELGPQDISSVLEFMCQINERVDAALFEQLFRKVNADVKRLSGTNLPRRVVVKVPSYSQDVLDAVKRVVCTELRSLWLPPGLCRWLCTVINVIPAPTACIAEFAKVSRSVLAGRVAHALDERNTDCQLGEWVPAGSSGAWVVKPSPSPFDVAWEDIEQLTRVRTLRDGRRCHEHFRAHPCLENSTGHVVLRTTNQWCALVGEDLGLSLASNARNRVYPTHTSLLGSPHSFAQNLQSISFPQFSVESGKFTDPTRLLSDDKVQVLLDDIATTTCDKLRHL